MSGIAGYWKLQQNTIADSSDAILAMINAIAHRGPDGQQTQELTDLAFAHAHLHSSPQRKSETLPLLDPSSRCLITADARLDHRDALIHTLNIKAKNPKLIGDGHIILHAYLKWGEDCPKYLQGDFAFAIWNPHSRTLFAARDRFGIKPLVYYSDKHLFCFASQPKAVLACPGVPHSINENRIADFLVPWLEGIDHSSTFFEQIHRLPPAHSIIVSPEKKSIQRYWQLEAPPELQLSSDAEYEEAFREHFTRAVDRCLQGGDKVGAMLSGGLDSSAVVAIARELRSSRGEPPLKTFSAILPESEPFKETDCVFAVIAQGKITAETIDRDEYAQNTQSYQGLAAICDNPFDFQMDVLTAVYKRASQTGINAVMDGIEGDLTTSLSTRYLLYLIRSGQLLSAATETLGLSRRLKNTPQALRKLVDCSIPAIIPKPLWQLARKRRRHLKIQQHLHSSFISPEFAEHINIKDRIGALYDKELPEIEACSIVERQTHIFGLPFLTAALEDYDNIAARHGVEPLHPFLDLDLVHFCLSLPWRQKIRNGWHKRILREAIGPLLPNEIQQRVDRMHPGSRFAEAAFIKELERFPSGIRWSAHNPIHEYVKHQTVPHCVESSQIFFLSHWLEQWA